MPRCKVCDGETKRSKSVYCSNECKFSDKDYNTSRISKIKNPDNKVIKYKPTGQIFKDVLNTSGTLTKFCKAQGIPYNLEDWEIVEVDVREKFKCPYCKWTTTDIDHKSGAFKKHLKKAHNKIVEDVYEEFPDLQIRESLKEKRLSHIHSKQENAIQCKECGFHFKKLSQTHLALHNMTPAEYKLKYSVRVTTSKTTSNLMSKIYQNNDNILKYSYRSKAEMELQQYLEQLGEMVVVQDRSLGIELDLYIPSKKIAIEYDGLYWHGEANGGKSRNYHITKTQICEKNGIHLVHIFEDEFLTRKSVVKSRLANLLGKTSLKIPARKCTVANVPLEVAKQFFNETHTQGYAESSIRLGLYYQNTLVACMTFSKPRKIGISGNYDYELVRFSTKLDTTVVGGAQKLLTNFLKKYPNSSIVSFADRRWTCSTKVTLYEQLGFTCKGVTPPNYWYILDSSTKLHRYNFTKHKILQNYPQARKELSEWENMQVMGYDRIWDCGSIKYVKENLQPIYK